MIQDFYFDSKVGYDPSTGRPTYDRPSSGAGLRQVNKMFYSNGVYPDTNGITDSFKVVANGNLNEALWKLGYGHIEGSPFFDTEDYAISFPDADSNLPRYDLCIFRWNNTNDGTDDERHVTRHILSGVAASTPVFPQLTRVSNGIWEIAVAAVYRRANSTLISDADITDLRGNSVYCGWLMNLPTQINTDDLWNQYATWLADIQAAWEIWWNNQQDTSGYLIAGQDYPVLKTEDKTVLGAINENFDFGIVAYNTGFRAGEQAELARSEAASAQSTATAAYNGVNALNAYSFLTVYFTGTTMAAGGGIVLYRLGNTVFVNLNSATRGAVTAYQEYNIGTVPVGWRPRFCSFFATTANSRVYITETGAIMFLSVGGTSGAAAIVGGTAYCMA